MLLLELSVLVLRVDAQAHGAVAVARLEVALPQIGRLEDVAVGIDGARMGETSHDRLLLRGVRTAAGLGFTAGTADRAAR